MPLQLNALYVDFNSYFASVEQQLRPELRNLPIGVLPVMADTTCCIAASYEAKAFGVKTGTSVKDAIRLCPDIIFVEARPQKYIEYHHQLIAIVESCTPVEEVLSIDEMVCKLTGSQQKLENALALAAKIKQQIAKQAGTSIRCSIGIAPNKFLAKLASDMQKPDGCVVIEEKDIPHKLLHLKVKALNGIGRRMEARLLRHGIDTMEALYSKSRQELRAAWGSVEGERMYEKLRGIEPHRVKNSRKSLGHSHVLPPKLRNPGAAFSVLHRLLQKAGVRLRSYGLHAGALHVFARYVDHPTWEAAAACTPTDDTQQLLQLLQQLWEHYPPDKTEPLAVGITLSRLADADDVLPDLFSTPINTPKRQLDDVLDQLNQKYGKNTVYFGGAYQSLNYAPLRIAFNHIPDLALENEPAKPLVPKKRPKK